MTIPRPNPDPNSDRDAAEWVARIDRGLTAREQDAFFLWLAADPRHGDSLTEHRATQRSLQLLAQWRPEHGAQPNPDLLAPPAMNSTQPHLLRRTWFIGLAAAATVMIGASFVSWDFLVPSAAPTAELRAEGGEHRRMLLSDGSTIDLRGHARVNVHYTVAERRIVLVEGSAHFVVAPNPQRPFFVETEGAAVRALGTAFNVHLNPNGVEVLVTHGTVAVSIWPARETLAVAAAPIGESRTAVAQAGHRVTIATTIGNAAEPVVSAFEPSDHRRLAASQSFGPRHLEFTDAPLASVVAELNRDNRVKIIIADPVLAALPIGASLQSDNVDGFIRLLERRFRVAVERMDDTTLVLRGAR